MGIKGEFKTRQQADIALDKLRKNNPMLKFRIVRNRCGSNPKEYPYLIQCKYDKNYICLHD